MKQWKKSLHLFLVIVILTGMLGFASVSESVSRDNVQPALAQLVAESPEQEVRVIVQQAGSSAEGRWLTEQLGGSVLKELSLINAFVVELPAQSVARLAQSDAVSWVSLDAPMEMADVGDVNSTAFEEMEGKANVRDEFGQSSYGNNDGSLKWTTDWTEAGDDGTPTAGNITISNNKLKLVELASNVALYDTNLQLTDVASKQTAGVQRSVNLAGASSAMLSFEYSGSSDDRLSTSRALYPIQYTAGVFAVDVSSDGTNFTTLDTIKVASSNSGIKLYDLQEFVKLTSNTTIRFRLVEGWTESGQFVALDNVQLEVGIIKNKYLETLGVDQLHAEGITGQGIGVAVIDSGTGDHADFEGRLQHTDKFGGSDIYGHGTHVAGIAGGDGSASGGVFSGVAPGATIIPLGVSDETGMAYESDVVEALQWVFDNKDLYNIRVVNLSLNSTVEDSYHNSGIDAAVEILWFNGVVVVASAGNKGPAGGYNTARSAPANDPFLIAVGASNEHSTADRVDDTIAPYSAFGTTQDGFFKPDLIAPGHDIYSALSPDSTWDEDYPDRVGYAGQYFRISGTSMAAPMVSGVVALLLQDEPGLTPNQVKYRLLNTSSKVGGDPYIDAYAAVHGTTTAEANQGIMPHMLLAKMAMIAYWASQNGEENIDWENVDWGSVNWNAVNWNAVNWNAVNWNAVNWNAVNWNAVNWNAVNWNAVNWNAVNWNAVNWNAMTQLDGVFWGRDKAKNK